MNATQSQIRAFIALHPPEPVLDALEAMQSRWKTGLKNAAIRWTRREQLHLTTQFLGNIEARRLPDFEAALQAACAGFSGIRLSVESLGCFPGETRPRILWAGAEGEVETLEKLKLSLDDTLAPLNYVPEKRRFHPHLTLARVGELRSRDRLEFSKLLELTRETRFGPWQIGSVALMQSVLSPAGARYSSLIIVPLLIPPNRMSGDGR